MSLARAQGVDVDEAALTKLLLFERCGNETAYKRLTDAISHDDEGKPRFLSEWEEKANSAEELVLDGQWDDDFVREWLTLPPRLGDLDLRGALYVSREHAPLIAPEDRLSSDGADVLKALLEHPEMAADLQSQLVALPGPELSVILDRLLERARQIQDWGVPPELNALIAVTHAEPSQGARLAAFLGERPPKQITPALVQKISVESWASDVFDKWHKLAVSGPVKKAMEKPK